MDLQLIPLCRGLEDGSSGRGGVRNGGLWWPERASEWRLITLQTLLLPLLSSPEMMDELLGR